jgi:hypothetical protein
LNSKIEVLCIEKCIDDESHVEECIDLIIAPDESQPEPKGMNQ